MRCGRYDAGVSRWRRRENLPDFLMVVRMVSAAVAFQQRVLCGVINPQYFDVLGLQTVHSDLIADML